MVPLVKSAIAILLLVGAPTAALAAVGTPSAAGDPARYRRCQADSTADPKAALADAQAWMKTGGGVPAGHCAALALIGLKRYGEAGERLDRIAAAPDVPGTDFRVALFNQAGNAWLLAGDGAHAIESFQAALTLSPGDADLFADLARAHAMRRNWLEVDMDMNAALQISPRRVDLLVLRASARRALKHYEAARTDLEAALKIKPGDGNALVERGLLRRQVGDIGGARRDFEAALKSGSPGVVADAHANLDELKP